MRNNKTLKYDSARLAILNFIAEHGLKAGDRLPSEREMTSLIPGSIITLRHALAMLEESKVIERRTGGRRAGTYIRKQFLQTDKFSTEVLLLMVMKPSDSLAGSPLILDLRILMDYFNSRGIGIRTLFVKNFDQSVIRAVSTVSGIMMNGWITEDFIAKLKATAPQVPMIVIGNLKADYGIPVVSIDNRAIAYKLTRCFIHNGRRRIVLFRGADDYFPYIEFESGYLAAMDEAGFQPVVARTTDGHFSEMLETFMPAHLETEAILMYSSMLDRFVSWLWRSHSAIQPDIGFLDRVSIIDKDYVPSGRVKWTTHELPSIEAARLLHQAILNDTIPASKVIEPIII